MKLFKSGGRKLPLNMSLDNIRITKKLMGLLVGLLLGFTVIGGAYYQVLEAEKEAVQISEKMSKFENGIHEVQVDLLNARRNESEFYLKKYPIFLGKFDTRIIVASQNLKGLTNLVKDEQELNVITELGDAFEVYRERFIRAAEIQVELGLDENTGLNAELINVSESLYRNIEKHNVPALERSLLKIYQLQNDFILKEDEKYHQNAVDELSGFVDILEKSGLKQNDKLATRKLISEYKEIIMQMHDLISVMKNHKEDVKLAVKQIEPLFEKLLKTSEGIILDTRQKALIKQNNITVFFITTLLVTAVLVSVVLMLFSRSIISPMKRLQETVLKVNEGDLNARSRLSRRDELGELANAFDKLLDERLASLAEAEKESERLNESVITMIQYVSKLAQGKDLAVRVPVSEDITGAIGDSLNLLAKETARILSEVKSTSNQVAHVSSVVKTQADHVISVAKTERIEVDATAELLKESVENMNAIALDSQSANRQADITIENTQKALDAVLTSVSGINSIRNTISETEKRIKRLGERSQEITGIVNLINSIAERTHILALNASMHAASAGEAGRGFAVVADEVQRLAENARQATSEISTVVNNIRIETADTVATMNTVISLVAEGTRLAEQAGTSMKDTQKATSELVNSVQHIAQSSMNQAGITKQLLERARQIQQTTEQTGRELYEQSKNTETLVRYSADLVSTVAVFKLPGDSQKIEKSNEDKDFVSTAELRAAS